MKKCENCLVVCKSLTCYNNHKKNVCNKNKKCEKCGAFETFKHNCSGYWCNFCKKNTEVGHKCFIIKSKETKIDFSGYIFFDYECMHTSNNQHEPNLIVSTRLCVECVNKTNFCDGELCKTYVFYNNNEFGSWLFHSRNKNFIAVAHNMKSYDGFFIMRFIINNLLPTDNLPEILLNGSKLLVIKFNGVKIIDSINFIPMALSKLPKTFGLAELKKGYFPHFFNTPENQKYIGEYPSENFYGCEYMSVEENNKFRSWYSTQKNQTFNLQEELLSYCKSDVDILVKSCLKFRELFMMITTSDDFTKGIDPFINSLTMPSACHDVYRKLFMPENSIALIPDFGYQNQESTSVKAILWLKYISAKFKINIRHARNGGEKKIDNFKLDGWHEETETAYEFHGCPKCYNETTFNSPKNEHMSETYMNHVKRINHIKTKVKNLVEIWECEYNNLVKGDEHLHNIVKDENDLPYFHTYKHDEPCEKLTCTIKRSNVKFIY